jgi:hypothetical protein
MREPKMPAAEDKPTIYFYHDGRHPLIYMCPGPPSGAGRL